MYLMYHLHVPFLAFIRAIVCGKNAMLCNRILVISDIITFIYLECEFR